MTEEEYKATPERLRIGDMYLEEVATCMTMPEWPDAEIEYVRADLFKALQAKNNQLSLEAGYPG